MSCKHPYFIKYTPFRGEPFDICKECGISKDEVTVDERFNYWDSDSRWSNTSDAYESDGQMSLFDYLPSGVNNEKSELPKKDDSFQFNSDSKKILNDLIKKMKGQK